MLPLNQTHSTAHSKTFILANDIRANSMKRPLSNKQQNAFNWHSLTFPLRELWANPRPAKNLSTDSPTFGQSSVKQSETGWMLRPVRSSTKQNFPLLSKKYLEHRSHTRSATQRQQKPQPTRPGHTNSFSTWIYPRYMRLSRYHDSITPFVEQQPSTSKPFCLFVCYGAHTALPIMDKVTQYQCVGSSKQMYRGNWPSF